MEVRIVQARHAEVSQYYNQGKFNPVAELSDDTKVVVIALEEGKRLLVTKDVKAGPVYDHCGYMIAQEWCDWEELEALRDKLGLGNFNRRVYVYNGAERIMQTLMTIAGQHIQIKFSDGAENLAKHINSIPDCEAEVIGDHALSVYDWSGQE